MKTEVHPDTDFNRTHVFVAACLGMFMFGVVMTMLGTILPSVMDRFDIDLSGAGSVIAQLSAGILTGSLVFGPVVDRYGYRPLLSLAMVLVIVGLEGIAFASSVVLLRTAVFLIGFGGGMINGATNALVADISEGERSAGLSLLGVSYGIGAFSIPFLFGLLVQGSTYVLPVAVVGAVAIVPLAYTLAIRVPQPKQAQGFPVRESMKLVREATLALFGLMLFIQSGIEMTVGNWTTSFLAGELGLDTSDAAFYLSSYLLGMMAARLIMGTALKHVSPAHVLHACLGLGFVGAVLLILAHTIAVAVTGLVLLGAGLAAGFPVVLGYVGDYYTRLSGTAFSIVLVMALAGGSLFPLGIGTLGEVIGLRASFTVIPVSLAFMAILFGVIMRRGTSVRSRVQPT